jgi:hypothetical protein
MQLDQSEVLKLAGEALTDPRTVRRAYEGESVKTLTRLRLERAAKELGFPIPPPTPAPRSGVRLVPVPSEPMP